MMRGLAAVAGLLALALGQAPGGPERTPIGTLVGSSVELTGGPARMDAQGALQVPEGATIALAGKAAKLALERGGAVNVCGPARLSVERGGGGALQFSLQAGALNLRYATGVADALLTPDFRVTTLIPAGQLAAVSANVSLSANGDMCIANHGSALTVERLWNGQQRYLIGGQSAKFEPNGGEQSVKMCPCAAAPPQPVPEMASKNGAAGAMFPSEPALTVNAGETGAGGATAGGTGSDTAATANGTADAAAGKKRGNFLARFFRWLF